MKHLLATICLTLAAAFGFPVSAQDQPLSVARQALATYIALREGRIRPTDLSPRQRQDVEEIDRLIQGETLDLRSLSQRCIDEEIAKSQGIISELEWRSIRLKCREVGDP